MKKAIGLCLAVLTLFLVQCKSSTSSSGGSSPTLFFTGSVQTDSSNYSLTEPAYWKGGTLNILNTGTYTNGQATGWISPDNGATIYIAGNVQNGTGPTVPVYWKNGTLNVLAIPAEATGGAAQADGITRDTLGHIYINGYVTSTSTGQYLPGYWKDGTWVDLSMTLPAPYNSTGIIGYALDKIAIDASNHVYVSGWILDPASGGKNVPVYWVDDTVNVVSLPSTSTYIHGGEVQATMLTNYSWASSYLSTFTVLVRAYDSTNYSPLALYVQGNNPITAIPTTSSTITATNAAVWWMSQSPSGDLYANGEVGVSTNFWTTPTQPPVYWKNWALVALPGITGQPYGQTGGTWFSGSDIYISGTTYSDTVPGLSAPVYWLNGKVHQLSLATSTATYVGGYTYDLGFLK